MFWLCVFVWVSVNVGLGKIFVLFCRVVCLFFDGIDLLCILVLIFIKVVVVEMVVCVFKIFGIWVMMDDEVLSWELMDIEGCKFGVDWLVMVWCLFVVVLEIFGGLKI